MRVETNSEQSEKADYLEENIKRDSKNVRS